MVAYLTRRCHRSLVAGLSAAQRFSGIGCGLTSVSDTVSGSRREDRIARTASTRRSSISGTCIAAVVATLLPTLAPRTTVGPRLLTLLQRHRLTTSGSTWACSAGHMLKVRALASGGTSPTLVAQLH